MKKLKTTKAITILIIFLIITVSFISLLVGEINISFSNLCNIIKSHVLSTELDTSITKIQDYTIWNIRLPRLILAFLVGACLSLAGALLQGIFGNPLADPGVIGVSSGAAVGACTAIYLASTNLTFNNFFANTWTQIIFSFVFGLLTVLLVLQVSMKFSTNTSIIMILSGIAINAFCGGLISFLTTLGSNISREQMIFWQMGSLNGAKWEQIPILFGILVFCLFFIFRISKKIDIINLGEKQATYLGISVKKLKRNTLLLVAILTAGAVSFTGLILFIGLIVPHILRLIIGPKNEILIPLSSLFGGLFLISAETISRIIIPNSVLPIGMITSFMGGPIFLFLVLKTSKKAQVL